MASIFTYDPDPPRVSSPWLSLPHLTSGGNPTNAGQANGHPQTGLLSEYGATKLEAEPQDGPTEYKLHLLLRLRRPYKSMTTAGGRGPVSTVANQAKPASSTSVPVSQTRQQRLQHLTTQLLWRLQQSSPYHASSSKELSIPKLSDDSLDTDAPPQLQALVPGLEESRGALYEIGVSDDGTLVGLTNDEMDESIATLRVMAASLGCSVEVVRMVTVGECEWIEPPEPADKTGSPAKQVTRQGRLWVAEALVTPHLGPLDGTQHLNTADRLSSISTPSEPTDAVATPSRGSCSTPQLRVTFTGPTMSGKSSLLGTLSTGTLDNGRGMSRLSLLKHRHEMVSGVTSSIAQELIGYKDRGILNFSHANIESWVDIHDFSENGRLVFVSDSGGHPRYRRTVLRGLMNWAPHWSILCIAADDREETPNGDGATTAAQQVSGSAATSVDLVNAHLDLSLKLDVPMAVIITKLDLASKASLQKTMIKVLDAVKKAGRTPKILQPDQRQHAELKQIPNEDYTKVQAIVDSISNSGSLTQYIPIVLTSAVKGTGIGMMHALLESLPLPPPPTSRDFVGMALNPEQPKCLFHIDDTFNLPAAYGSLAPNAGRGADQGLIVSGHARFGNLSVGDEIVVGPFPSGDEDSREFTPEERQSPGSYGLSISNPSSAELARIVTRTAVSASAIAGEWHRARIVSIRNLRLPVRTLEAGQAGSIGLVFAQGQNGQQDSTGRAWDIPRIRRGMVLAIPSKHMLDTNLSLQAASGFTATFDDAAIKTLAVGTFVNVYVASVRAVARVLGVTHHRDKQEAGAEQTDEAEDIFELSGDMEEGGHDNPATAGGTGGEVFLELLHNREWVELGSKVILLEGSSQVRSGLEGLVGKIIEIVE